MTAFQDTFWNLAQTLYWICLRDRDLVECASDDVRRFVDERIIEPDPKMRLLDGKPDIHPGDHPDEFEIDFRIVCRSFEQDGPFPMVPYCIRHRDLLRKLQSGEISSTGEPNGRGDPIDITRKLWSSLVVHWPDRGGPPFAARPDIKFEPTATTWENIKLRREDVLRLWPEIKLETKPAKSVATALIQDAGLAAIGSNMCTELMGEDPLDPAASSASSGTATLEPKSAIGRPSENYMLIKLVISAPGGLNRVIPELNLAELTREIERKALEMRLAPRRSAGNPLFNKETLRKVLDDHYPGWLEDHGLAPPKQKSQSEEGAA